MAQKAYGGVGGKARNGIALYCGVNGKARKVVKGYVGVNGKARQFWGARGWRRETDIPYNMMEGCAVAYHDKIHIFGGNASDVRRNHYSWDGEVWRQETDIPIDMTYPSVVVYEDKIHLFHGWNHYTWQEVGNAGAWNQLNNLPGYPNYANIVGNNHAVVLNGKLTLLSSNASNYGWWRYVCVWNENADDWVLSNVIGNWNYQTATAYNNLAYLMGGSGGDNRPYLIWDGSAISEGGYIGYNFQYGSTVVYNDKVHLLGTQAGSEENNKRHSAFDGSTFADKTKLPYPFYRGSACVFRGKIHIFGGMYNIHQTEHWSYEE